jgi:type 1 fimbria pilin
MQMVQNKKIGAGLAVIAALVAMGASGSASALPEMEVGSHLVAGSNVDAQAQGVAPDEVTIDAEDGTVASDEEAGTSTH